MLRTQQSKHHTIHNPSHTREVPHTSVCGPHMYVKGLWIVSCLNYCVPRLFELLTLLKSAPSSFPLSLQCQLLLHEKDTPSCFDLLNALNNIIDISLISTTHSFQSLLSLSTEWSRQVTLSTFSLISTTHPFQSLLYWMLSTTTLPTYSFFFWSAIDIFLDINNSFSFKFFFFLKDNS